MTTHTPYTLSQSAGLTVTDLTRQLTRAENEIARLRLMMSHNVDMRLSQERIICDLCEEIEALRLALKFDVVRRNWRAS